MESWIPDFESFIQSDEAPLSASMAYQRVMKRHYDKMTHCEPKAMNGDHDHNEIDSDDEELMALVGLKGGDEYDEDDALFKQLHKGIDFNWGTDPKVSIRAFFCLHIFYI